MRLVLDASVAVEYLLRTPLGRGLAPRLEAAELLAPELVDAEVLAVLRRAVRARLVSDPRARAALADLRDWPMRRLPHAPLLDAAWDLRHNVSAYEPCTSPRLASTTRPC